MPELAKVWTQAACEEFLSSMWADCSVLRRHAGRSQTVYKKDLQLLIAIRSGRVFEQVREDAQQAYLRDVRTEKAKEEKKPCQKAEAGIC